MIAALAMPVGVDRRSDLLGLIADSGAAEACRSRVSALRGQAVAVIRESPLNVDQGRGFLDLVEDVRGRAGGMLTDDRPLDSRILPHDGTDD